MTDIEQTIVNATREISDGLTAIGTRVGDVLDELREHHRPVAVELLPTIGRVADPRVAFARSILERMERMLAPPTSEETLVEVRSLVAVALAGLLDEE